MGVLEGQGLIVTGAGRPLAQAVIAAARDAGGGVFACTHRPGQTVDDGPDEHRASPIAADLADELVVDALFDLAADRVPLSVLANIVHPGDGGGRLVHVSEEEWNEALVSSLHTSFLLIQRAVGEFICGDGGRIVNVIDMTDHEGPGGVATVTRTALLSMSRCVAKEYGRRGVACSTVVAWRGDAGSGGSPEDAAETVVFLASGDASIVTGDELHVTIHTRATRTADQERARCESISALTT
ncbi:SDR family NAD(P)-dependent oxidoreductase [Actinomadura sp. 3N407]|uniref:SDR family NAD(P)-dependent oxidoreductase n=1 Tax=Actinomadura sp. 3N407 TaxID=3457423 RepID=UPI003FCD748F